MALQAVEVPTEVPELPLAHPGATITELRVATRSVTQCAMRQQRRRWFALGAVVCFAPAAACLGILEVVR